MSSYDERRFRQRRARDTPRRTVYSAVRIVKESTPLLAALVLVQIAAGQVLEAKSGLLFDAPVLLLLIPAVNGLGGNIGSVLGARISSGLHLGTIPPNLRGPTLWVNVRTALLLALASYVALALAVRVLSDPFDMPVGLGPVTLFILIVGAGLTLALLVTILTVASALISFRQGLDPDNHVIPVVTSSGDLLGILTLLTLYGLVVA